MAEGINPQAITIAEKIISKYKEVGAVTFPEIVQDILDTEGEESFVKYFPALKAGYGAMLLKNDDALLTTVEELSKSKLEDFL